MIDAIIVLGGGVREGGLLPPWIQARFDLALAISANVPLVCCSAGTVHRPPPHDENGFPWLECVAGARYAIERGCDPARILLEAISLDTIGNAYFSRVLHADRLGWRKLAVITSEFHMVRSEAIFRWVYGLPQGYELEFKASPDIGMPERSLLARQKKEAASLTAVERLRARIRDMQQLGKWIYREHAAYSTAILNRAPDVSDADSY